MTPTDSRLIGLLLAAIATVLLVPLGLLAGYVFYTASTTAGSGLSIIFLFLAIFSLLLPLIPGLTAATIAIIKRTRH